MWTLEAGGSPLLRGSLSGVSSEHQDTNRKGGRETHTVQWHTQ